MSARFVSYTDLLADLAGPVAEVCSFLYSSPAVPFQAELMSAAVDPPALCCNRH